jgi:hypothetical protein
MSAEPVVRFLVAGVQKGGTSALFEYLRAVPGLELPAVKEAHHFDDELEVDWSRPDHGGYHALFANDGRLCGEATPIYCYWPDSLERIRAYNPAMRLILLFRDPVARAFSHWQMEYARGAETEPFAWCIREGRARVHSDPGARAGHHRVFSYVERGFYGQQLARVLALFPREQVLLLRSEDLKHAPTRRSRGSASFWAVARAAGDVAPRAVRTAKAIAYPSVLSDADRTLLDRTYARTGASLPRCPAGQRVAAKRRP